MVKRSNNAGRIDRSEKRTRDASFRILWSHGPVFISPLPFLDNFYASPMRFGGIKEPGKTVESFNGLTASESCGNVQQLLRTAADYVSSDPSHWGSVHR
jgi:hypothetical protein